MTDVKYAGLPEHSARLLKWKAPHPPKVTICARTFEEYSPQPDSNPYWEDHAPLFTVDQLHEFADATCALREAQKESGWRPIETAPKDGTPIRLYAQGGGFYDEDFNPSGSVEGFWHDGAWSGAFWDGVHDTWYRRDEIVPTHWQPLPPPFAEDVAPTPEGEAK